MRFSSLALTVLGALVFSGCDYWPRDLGPLAESISEQVSGEATAWLVGKDVAVINVANSPLYQRSGEELGAVATMIAAQAVEFSGMPLGSIAVTFHEGDVSEDSRRMREFIFLVESGQPVLQPPVDMDAEGPLTLDEIRSRFIDRIDPPLSEARRACVLQEVEARARAAGDPETLDPSTVELLPAKTWFLLDAYGRRLVLSQAIATKATTVCD